MSVSLPPEPSPGQALHAAWGKQLLRWCRANMLCPSPDLFITRSANGTSLRTRPTVQPGGSVSVQAAFDLTISTASGNNASATFVPGTGQNLVPTNWNQPVPVPAGALSYAFLRLNSDGKSVQTCTLMVGTTAPVDPVPVKNALPMQVDVLLHLIGYTAPAGTAAAGTYTPYRVFPFSGRYYAKPSTLVVTFHVNQRAGPRVGHQLRLPG